MRKKIYLFLIGLLTLSAVQGLYAQTVIDSLTTPDPNIRKYFPRWRICENDIKIQVHQAFIIMGYDKKDLDMSKIEVLAAPRTDQWQVYDILSISCGKASMNANDINNNIPQLAEYINGSASFQTGEELNPPKRDYCFTEIPPSTPVTESQAKAILSYLEPTNVDHAITVSLFEQTLKVGSSDFWIKSLVGNDPAGYPFWSSGDSRIVLKRPLYVNNDDESKDRIPNLANAYLGGAYKITSGVNENSSNALSWVSRRKLNGSISGKVVAGFDVFMPFKPEAGISFNIDVPLEKLKEKGVKVKDFAYDNSEERLSNIEFNREGQLIGIAPISRANGQVTAFYNWWLNKDKAENYFRFDVGMAYSEVKEMALVYDVANSRNIITNYGIGGLKTYKPSEFGDWVFLKAEYRNQASFPFGGSIQYSNQILLGRIYLPVLKWLYVEGRYATPLRHVRPYEVKNFFMVSPVLRITL